MKHIFHGLLAGLFAVAVASFFIWTVPAFWQWFKTDEYSGIKTFLGFLFFIAFTFTALGSAYDADNRGPKG